jgi:hypothetical protein
MTRFPARRALSYTFRLESADDALGRWFDRLVSSFPESDDGDVDEWTVSRDDATREWCFRIGDEQHGRSAHPEHLVTTMLQTLNLLVVDHWPGPVGHAGCVARDGRAVILPADPESGKTTLTCGLVRAGFEYVTDEGVAFVPGTTRIEPYPKPMSLDPGSWFLFPELEPAPDPPLEEGDGEPLQWQVAPDAIRPGAASGPCTARWIVFPRYEEGARTELVPITRGEALVELAKNTFAFRDHSREYLDQLDVVVRACDCHRLTVGTLADAVACIEELVAHG